MGIPRTRRPDDRSPGTSCDRHCRHRSRRLSGIGASAGRRGLLLLPGRLARRGALLPAAGPLQRRPRGRPPAADARARSGPCATRRPGPTWTGSGGPIPASAGRAAPSTASAAVSTTCRASASPRCGSARSSSSGPASTPFTATASRTSSRSIRGSARARISSTLVEHAHARGMRIILDIIVNHTGDNWGYLPPDAAGRAQRAAVPAVSRVLRRPANPATTGWSLALARRAQQPDVPRRRPRPVAARRRAAPRPATRRGTRAPAWAASATPASTTRTPSTSAPTSSR